MRSLVIGSSIMLILLGWSCKESTQGILEPLSSKANSIKVSKVITKSIATDNTATTETVTVNGKEYKIGVSTISYFTYDNNDRVVTNAINYPTGEIDSTYYYYQNKSLLIKKIHIKVDGSREMAQETKILDGNGFVEYRPNNQAEYDKYGYITKLTDCCTTYELKSGNVIARALTIYPGGPLYTYNYQYDESKLSIPSPLNFYGHESRNLPTGYKVEEKTSFSLNPNKYYATYSYLYNTDNLVKREIFYANESNSKDPFAYGGEKLTINDYEYIMN